MRTTIILLAALSLAACGKADGGGNNSSDSDVPAATSQAEPPLALTQDNSQQAVPITMPAPTPIKTIPAGFHGRWGMVPNDCDPTKAYMAKGLMVIDADGLKFYESRARIGKLQQLTPNAIEGSFDYTGEGQNWSKQTRLTLQDAGRTLVRQESDPASADTYFKCPTTD